MLEGLIHKIDFESSMIKERKHRKPVPTSKMPSRRTARSQSKE
jgi:hypothetical protein